ncbi:hypothetical protein LDENG_00111890 [Lucifuga dentata]|nr:hypothetical protein LDENG_00111890 [Lucifuga dentata]
MDDDSAGNSSFGLPPRFFSEAMARQNTEAKLKSLLRQEKIQLWNPPYTVDNNQPGQQQMQNQLLMLIK